MAEAYLLNQRRLLPCAAYLDGEYGFKDLYGCARRDWPEWARATAKFQLSADEQAMLEKSAASVKKVIDIVKAQTQELRRG